MDRSVRSPAPLRRSHEATNRTRQYHLGSRPSRFTKCQRRVAPLPRQEISAGTFSLAIVLGVPGPKSLHACTQGRTDPVSINRILVVDQSGAEREIGLKRTPISHAENRPEKKPIGVHQLDWTWIKSDSNPMKDTAEVLPDWALKNWNSLSDDVKMDFQNRYRSHGWDFSVTQIAPNRIHVSNTRLIDPNIPPATEDQLRRRIRGAITAPGMQNGKK